MSEQQTEQQRNTGARLTGELHLSWNGFAACDGRPLDRNELRVRGCDCGNMTSRLNQTAKRTGKVGAQHYVDLSGQTRGELLIVGRIGTSRYWSGGTEHSDPLWGVRCIAKRHPDARSGRSLRVSGDRAKCKTCAALNRNTWAHRHFVVC